MTLPDVVVSADPPDQLGFPWGHILQRTIVLPELRLLFLPVPKAGCTSILWLLADLAGIDREQFAASAQPEVSPSTTVHDMSRWGDAVRLSMLDPEQRAHALTDDGWLRCTLVRDPARRLWSGWQSKLLLREPRFAAMFGDRDWFPRVPQDPDDIVDDFRRFVGALGSPEAADVHWCVQSDLVDMLPLNHIGRVEQMADTVRAICRHVSAAVEAPDEVPQENRAPLPQPAGLYDDVARAALEQHFRADYQAFGYAGPAPEPDGVSGEWMQRVGWMLPAVTTLIDRHERIGQLSAAAQGRRPGGRRGGPGGQPKPDRQQSRGIIANLEDDDDFTVRWAWSEGELEPGFTAVVRVKNESKPLPWVLPPLLRAVRHVLLVDNGSTDGTPDLAAEIARSEGAADRLEVRHYPFAVSRCGTEHLGTPANSVHSLTYFYNWSFSQVRTSYALKWDGDMVLTEAGVLALQGLEWQLAAQQSVITMNRYPLYVVDDSAAYLDIGLTNKEPWGWPNTAEFFHTKAVDWELPMWPDTAPSMQLPDWSCVEIKHLDADEFSHWSDTDFAASARTSRKRREWELFQAFNAGAEAPEHVVRIDAPAGTHVIDYVRRAWLPDHRRELHRLLRKRR